MFEKRWLTVKDCAEYLRLTESAVYNMIHRQELPYSKLGNRVRIDRHEVDQQMLRTRKEPTSSDILLKKEK
jgi:excisionase family DNA binding protein